MTGGLEGKRTLVRLRIRAKYSTLLDYVYTHKEHFRHVWFKPALLELAFYKESVSVFTEKRFCCVLASLSSLWGSALHAGRECWRVYLVHLRSFSR